MKIKEFNLFLESLSTCEKCLNIKNKNNRDCSLINIYKDHDFCRNIPSIWTDWFNRLDSQIMIIGQDWGPYKDMDKFYQLYKQDPTSKNWNNLIEEEKSLTKRMLEKNLVESAKIKEYPFTKEDFSKIFITNSIMCARKGELYRENNINLKDSTINCATNLKKQIDIIKPKVIITLGYYPLLSLSKIYNFKIENNLTKTIEKYDCFKLEKFIIIPIYHPAAQIKKEIQLSRYLKIWDNL